MRKEKREKALVLITVRAPTGPPGPPDRIFVKVGETSSHLQIRRETVYSTCARARESGFHPACSGHLSPVSRR